MPYTTTGVFGKSSNVGTLMLAQRVGPERYADMLGQVRSRPAHRRRTARRERGPGPADRPVVGQHLLQPADRTGSFDDAAADDRHVPGASPTTGCAFRRASSRPPSPPTAPAPRSRGPNGVRVVSPQTAQTVRNMLRAVVQRDPMGIQQGTGSVAAVDGYQIAGKTGTAQQINPACGCYYSDVYWITFAGHGTGRRPPLRHRHHDGQPAPHRRRVSRARRWRRCSTTSRLAAAARERPAVTRPRPAADAAGHLSRRASPVGRPVLCHGHEAASLAPRRPGARATLADRIGAVIAPGGAGAGSPRHRRHPAQPGRRAG